jgi:RNA polymerase sigma-70 factor (ECF subfamily)
MQLSSVMGMAFREGQRAWPGVNLAWERFSERTRELDIGEQQLGARSADLFLAWACAESDPAALRIFEAEILSRVETYVARFGLAPHALDEVRQKIRVKLLVGRSPGIRRYRGLGPLGAWVRVTAVRVALDLTAEAATSGANADLALCDLGASVDDGPELAIFRGLYRDRFRAGIEKSIDALAPRDKTLLRLYVVDGLNIEAIGAIYRVHRATVARWFVAIRSRVLASLRGQLGLRFEPSPSELRSLIRLLHDDIHLSARRILVDLQPP